MPTADVLIESDVEKSFRVEQVRSMFDLPDAAKISHAWHVDLPIESHAWQIGLIVGPSGSGKTVIAREMFADAHFHERSEWPASAAVVDAFHESRSVKEITAAFSSVGFSSPPHWLKPFSHLSNGQQFRCELARVLLDEHECVVFDEFSSVVDRDAAKISSAAVAKAIRRGQAERKFVALSCHFDVIDWLDPDWVYNAATGKFARRRLRRRPSIVLRIRKATRSAWQLFREHHYLDKELASHAQCFVATWKGTPVAFTSYINLVHPKVKNIMRGHRLVVLPDYQGVGIGVAVGEWSAARLAAKGYRYISTTSNPALIKHRLKSPNWKLTRHGRVSIPTAKVTDDHDRGRITSIRTRHSAGRITASFEYQGPALRSRWPIDMKDESNAEDAHQHN